MEYQKFPIIEVSLVLSNKEIETTKITDLLQMIPTKVRSVEDWPDTIKNSPDLPEQLRPRNEWIWSIEHEECNSTDNALKSLLNEFENKISILINPFEEYSIEKSIQILIHANSTRMPEVGLEVETIEFLHAIKAPIFFDIYTY